VVSISIGTFPDVRMAWEGRENVMARETGPVRYDEMTCHDYYDFAVISSYAVLSWCISSNRPFHYEETAAVEDVMLLGLNELTSSS
jgi:hypothetical protein